LRRKLSELADEGQAKREAGRWKLRLEGLEVAYDDVTRSKADSPRRKLADAEEAKAAAKPPLQSGAEERASIRDRMEAVAHDASMPRSEAERQIALLKRRMLELDVAEREGQLTEAEAMRKVVFEHGRRVRDLVLGIPVRIAADLAAEDEPAKVAIILEKALVEAMEGLGDALQS
jgi:hypothetical protein